MANDTLPTEILLHIFGYLVEESKQDGLSPSECITLNNAMSTCRVWQRAALLLKPRRLIVESHPDESQQTEGHNGQLLFLVLNDPAFGASIRSISVPAYCDEDRDRPYRGRVDMSFARTDEFDLLRTVIDEICDSRWDNHIRYKSMLRETISRQVTPKVQFKRCWLRDIREGVPNAVNAMLLALIPGLQAIQMCRKEMQGSSSNMVNRYLEFVLKLASVQQDRKVNVNSLTMANADQPYRILSKLTKVSFSGNCLDYKHYLRYLKIPSITDANFDEACPASSWPYMLDHSKELSIARLVVKIPGNQAYFNREMESNIRGIIWNAPFLKSFEYVCPDNYSTTGDTNSNLGKIVKVLSKTVLRELKLRAIPPDDRNFRMVLGNLQYLEVLELDTPLLTQLYYEDLINDLPVEERAGMLWYRLPPSLKRLELHFTTPSATGAKDIYTHNLVLYSLARLIKPEMDNISDQVFVSKADEPKLKELVLHLPLAMAGNEETFFNTVINQPEVVEFLPIRDSERQALEDQINSFWPQWKENLQVVAKVCREKGVTLRVMGEKLTGTELKEEPIEIDVEEGQAGE